MFDKINAALVTIKDFFQKYNLYYNFLSNPKSTVI